MYERSYVCSVVKEELSDDEARLPCFNGRVVSWVSKSVSVFNFWCCSESHI